VLLLPLLLQLGFEGLLLLELPELPLDQEPPRELLRCGEPKRCRRQCLVAEGVKALMDEDPWLIPFS